LALAFILGCTVLGAIWRERMPAPLASDHAQRQSVAVPPPVTAAAPTAEPPRAALAASPATTAPAEPAPTPVAEPLSAAMATPAVETPAAPQPSLARLLNRQELRCLRAARGAHGCPAQP
jgi:hypothetical protein